MKKFTHYLLIITMLSAHAGAWSWFGAEFKNEMTKQQNSTNKRLSDIKAGINDVQLKLGDISLNLSAEVSAQVQSAIKAVGYDKSNTETIGGDKTTTTTNDTDLMKQIFQGLSALFLAMIGFLKARINSLAKHNRYLTESRKKYQDRFLRLLSPEYNRIVEKEKGV